MRGGGGGGGGGRVADGAGEVCAAGGAVTVTVTVTVAAAAAGMRGVASACGGGVRVGVRVGVGAAAVTRQEVVVRVVAQVAEAAQSAGPPWRDGRGSLRAGGRRRHWLRKHAGCLGRRGDLSQLPFFVQCFGSSLCRASQGCVRVCEKTCRRHLCACRTSGARKTSVTSPFCWAVITARHCTR